MTWEKPRLNKAKILDAVLRDIPKISTAPRSLGAFAEMYKLQGKELDDFEDRVRAAEVGKVYKASDGEGNVYLLCNPWIGMPCKKLKYTYDEALRESSHPGSCVNAALSGKSQMDGF